jgi:hypothetical protein
MAPKKQKDQKKQPKKKDITALDLPPLPTDTQDILLQIPHLVHDHVSDHKTLTERFSKEGRCMHKLAELQKLSLADSPNHLEYRPNPYNRRTLKKIIGFVGQNDLHTFHYYFRQSSIRDWQSPGFRASLRCRRS